MAGLLIAVLLLAAILPGRAQAQQAPDTTVTLHVKQASLPEVLAMIERRTGVRFDYEPRLLAGLAKVNIDADAVPLDKLLEQLFHGLNVSYLVVGKGIVLHKGPGVDRITISGFVHDEGSNEYLAGASIVLPDAHAGVVSNNYGFYSITIPVCDSVRLVVSYVGYRDRELTVSGKKDIVCTPEIARNAMDEQVTPMHVTHDAREDNVSRNQPSMVDLTTDMLTSAPSYGNSGDLISSVQLLPGVQAGLEGSSGYSVRGGNTGQNIVLLDEAAIYNPSHLLGLAGIFNPAAVKYASFLKGGFPAGYGDHLSSVLDVVMKDGSSTAAGGSLQVGNIVSGLAFNGPLFSPGSSFFVAARRSTIDLWMQPLAATNYFRNYYFYDMDASFNFRLGVRDRLLLTGYKGLDWNSYTTDSSGGAAALAYNTHFGNLAGSLRWNHVFAPRVFLNTSLVFTDYRQSIGASQQGYYAELYSGIRDLGARTDLSLYPSAAHKIRLGADFLYQTLYPAIASNRLVSGSEDGNPIIPSTVPPKNARRLALYVGDDIRTGERTTLYLGLRGAYYNQDMPYYNLEPRFSFLYRLGSSTSLKASWSQMHQYIHLVQSYNASFPAELWIGSSERVNPESGEEYTAGIFKNLRENSLQASLEFYYKTMEHQTLLRGATTAVIDNNIEDKLIFGKGWSYGAEWIIRKNRGRWKGWLAYTFGYAWQQFDSLNQGTRFPYALDRRHSVDVSTSYAIDSHWKAALTFFYAGGRAFTLNNAAVPSTNPLFEDDSNEDGGSPGGAPAGSPEANNYRLAPYNRLDLQVSWRKVRRRAGRNIVTSWTLTVYNVYARDNTGFAYRTINPVDGKPMLGQALFLPVIPSLTYAVEF